jgi:4-hydroxybenzoate polyprenyltransferase
MRILQNSQKQITNFVGLLLHTTRFKSWISWLFIFWVGSTLFTLPTLNTFLISISFCTITASGFVINQYFDKDKDKLNPKKKILPMASGRLSSRNALIFFSVLTSFSFILTAWVDISLFPFFLLFFGLGLAYSASPLNLKKRPIIDLIVAGTCFGILPFLMGMQVVYPLTMDLSDPWIIRRYFDAFLCSIPFLLFQVSGHLFQAIGDYEADRNSGTTTFVVKYGKERSAKIGVTLFLLTAIIPLVYGLFGLLLTKEFMGWYLLMLLISLPAIIYLLNLFRSPVKKNVESLQKITNKFSPFALIIVYFCIIVLRTIIK